MPSPRFYCPVPLAAGVATDLPPGAARHAVRVLRLGVGDALTLFNGGGGEYRCRIASVDRDRVGADVLAHETVERESPIAITLVQALATGEKMDLIVQKAVELGVAAIAPVLSRRSVLRLEGERALRRIEHWRGVVVAACEQCGRNTLPAVAPIEPLERRLGKVRPGALRLLFDPFAAQSLKDLTPPAAGQAVEILIGAEGGLAPEEVDLARAAGFMPLRLGPRILRSETAGLAAIAALQCLWGDFERGGDLDV